MSNFLLRLLYKGGLKVLAPFYHMVSDKPLPYVSSLYKTYSSNEFRRHMEYLARKVNFLTASDYLNNKSVKNPALLSFDDGFKECHQVIKPILFEMGIPAIFFVNPNFISTDNIFYRLKISAIINSLNEEAKKSKLEHEANAILREYGHVYNSVRERLLLMKPSDEAVITKLMSMLDIELKNEHIYMNHDEVLDLKKEGHSIGGHSLDHPRFSDLSKEERRLQIQESVDYCQKEFNEELRLFAFPYYDFDMKTDLFQSMYGHLNIDLSFGTSGLKMDVFENSIQRLDMEKANVNIESYLRKKVLSYIAKKSLGRHVMKR